jgi:metallophosphoesterase (TIGR00282 family)
MKTIIIGDIVGRSGRNAVNKIVPQLRKEHQADFVIANGENMAGGRGLNTKTIKDLQSAKLNVITTGDHIWDQRQFLDEIKNHNEVLRPANLHKELPGKGYEIYTIASGIKIGVINLLGRVFMPQPSDCPFQKVDSIIKNIATKCDLIFVDFHAEATSEKIAMGRFLDGKVTCVFGTHTHVQTADEQIFHQGTAYITDIGMVGAKESILGRKLEPVIQKFSTGIPKYFEVENRNIELHGVIIQADPTTGKALNIQRIKKTTEL